MTEERNRYTFRAFVVGVLLSSLVVVMSLYSVNVLHASYLSIDHMPAGGIFVFFVFVGLVLPLATFISRWFHFSSAELILIYAMILLTSSITTMGLGTQFLSMLAGPFYYANPTNQWGKFLGKHVHSWFVPQDAEAVRVFFEGLEEGEKIPWEAWARPLIVWMPFLFTLYFVMICTGVLLRRQWVQNERLTFPLTYLPLDIVQPEDGKSRIRPFFKCTAMWVGFALPFFVGTLNALNHYNQDVPNVELVKFIPVMEHYWYLEFRISFPIIGFAYFINSKVAFGLWFFNILAQTLRGWFISVGIESGESMGPYGAWSPIFKHVGMGAFFVLVFYGLYAGRKHFIAVLRKAVLGAPDVDDSDEILSYRAAFWGWGLGILALAGWLHMSGLVFHLALAFILLALLIFVGILRVVAQGGLPTLIAPSVAPSQLISCVGCGPIGPAGIVTLGFTYIWSGDIRTFAMSSALHGMKLDTEAKARSHRPLFWAMMAAVLIGVVGSSLVVMLQAHDYGGVNLSGWYFRGNTRAAFRFVADKINNPSDINSMGWMCKSIGAAAMLGLMFLQRNLYWWPIHPLGFAIGANGWTNKLWFSIFLAWVIKGAIIKYGGGRIFRSARPFFLGMILGQYSCAGFWFVVDCFTGKTGNMVFWI